MPVLLKSRIYPAFAVLGVGGPARTEQLYTRWVQRLATAEYADELVVLAVTLELPVRVVVIPYTPAFALQPWPPSVYGAAALTQNGRRTAYLGNNNVHYVYLSPRREQ